MRSRKALVRLNHHRPSAAQTIKNTISSVATMSLLPPPRAPRYAHDPVRHTKRLPGASTCGTLGAVVPGLAHRVTGEAGDGRSRGREQCESRAARPAATRLRRPEGAVRR